MDQAEVQCPAHADDVLPRTADGQGTIPGIPFDMFRNQCRLSGLVSWNFFSMGSATWACISCAVAPGHSTEIDHLHREEWILGPAEILVGEEAGDAQHQEQDQRRMADGPGR